jgi:hypothetical protein
VVVVAPTDLGVTFTETPVVNPNPGTSIYEGAAFGPFTVFYSATDNFYIYENSQFLVALPAQGFVAFNAAPTDTGVNFIGRNAADQYGTAQIDFCGGAPSEVRFGTFARQDFNFSGGVFWNGNSTDVLCGGTPGNGKVFVVEHGGEPKVFDVPAGSHLQDVFPDANGCVALGTGNNTAFRFVGNQVSLLDTTPLDFTPGSGTVAGSGNYYITDAFDPKLYEYTRDGRQVASHDLSTEIFRIHALPNGDVLGLAPPRTFVMFDPDFELETTYLLSGTGNDILDFKPAPGERTLIFLRDPTVGRSFARTLQEERVDAAVRRANWLLRAYSRDACLGNIEGR